MDPNIINVLEQGGYLPNYSVIIVVWQICGLLGYLGYNKLFKIESRRQIIWDYPSNFSTTNTFIDDSEKVWPSLRSYLEKIIVNPNDDVTEAISRKGTSDFKWIEELTIILASIRAILISLIIFTLFICLISSINITRNGIKINLTSFSNNLFTFLLKMKVRTSLLVIGGRLFSSNLLIFYFFNFSTYLILVHMAVTLFILISLLIPLKLYSYYEKWKR
jgi:hypothetical protein